MLVHIRSLWGQSIVRGGVRVMVVNAMGMALAYITHMLFARWLGVEPYGHYIYALAWLNVLVTMAQLGMNTSTIRITAELRAEGSSAAIEGLLRFSTVVVLGAGIAVICVGGAVLLAVKEWNLLVPGQILAMGTMLPLVVVLSLLNQRMAILQGFERVAQAQVYREIVRPLLLIAIMAVAVGFVGAEAHFAMAANLAATSIAFIAVSLVLKRFLARCGHNPEAVREFRNRTWLKVSLPYLVIGCLTVIMDQSDVLILGTLAGGTAAGLYLPAAKLSQLILFPMLAIRSHVAPLLAKLHAEKNHFELQRQMNVTTISSLLSGFVLLLFIVWQREFLLGLFGAEFVEAAPAIVVLALGMGVFFFTGGVEVFLIVGPFERLTVLIYTAVVIANIGLNLILIQLYGFMGAAYATSITIVFRGVLSSYVVWKNAGVLPWKMPLPAPWQMGEEK